jgi:hypothetical protein
MLKNRINLAFEVYNKKTTDLLQRDARIVSSTGFQSIKWYNAGSVLNRGWEIMLNLNNIYTAGKWKFSLTNVNLSRNVNKILSLPDNLITDQFTLANGNYARKVMEGNPIGSIYGFRFEGIYQNYDQTLARDAQGSLIRDINGNTVPIRIGGTWRQRPGDVKYADLNYDGVIDAYDIVYLGSSFPTVTGGASLRIDYGPWMLRISAHARLGQSIVNKVRHDMESMNTGDNQARTTLNRWRYEGDLTDVPRALWGTNYNSLGSSRFVEDGSFVKIKDVTLNYRVPERLTRLLGVTRASFFFTSYNLFTFTRYTGQDPEVGTGNRVLAIAVDENRTPPSRRFAAGLSFDF